MTDDRLNDFIERHFSTDKEGKDDKVVSLHDAVKQHIHPGMTIHLAFPAYHRANAIVREIIRQYWGKKPEFTFMCVGFGVQNFAHVLFHGGLLRKAVSTFFADAYPTPGPNPVFQEAYARGDVELQHWSILTYTARLLAGAMGIGFMPTRSLMGSSMAEENSDDFQVIEDPFQPGVKRGVVRAFNPDITLIHGLAADSQGNTILAPPYAENVYGAFASKNGVMITAERLVSTEFIRKYSHMVKIPSPLVRSVSIVPWGAHPLGVSSAGVPEIEVYAEDYDFLETARKACRDKAELEEWIHKWVLDCPDQAEYLRRLGQDRILSLKGQTFPDAWRYEMDTVERAQKDMGFTASEMMIIAMSRLLEKKILTHHYATILAGIGQANLAAWLANYRLKAGDYPINLIAEIGMFGYAPRPGDPFIFNHGNVPTAKMLTDSFHALGMMVSGETNNCIGALGTALVDEVGNLNSTVIAPDTLISGSGGGNDTAAGSREVVVSMVHSPGRLVKRVEYITTPGGPVKTLVTTLGVFEKLSDDDTFTLTALVPSADGPTVAERVNEIKEKTGWEVKVLKDIRFIEPPTEDELEMLRMFDPHRHFTCR
jgi:acyl CoA:acetate/3-ketoacid CoA transferase alpha subunit/acyl CoA:acetate/3-ketoacid CoA transferase beta subunit